MKHTHLLEKVDRYATTLSLRNLSSEPDQESFDILPGDVRTGRVGEQGFESLPVAALHGAIVPRVGTEDGSEA
jgi:hypothetical protein